MTQRDDRAADEEYIKFVESARLDHYPFATNDQNAISTGGREYDIIVSMATRNTKGRSVLQKKPEEPLAPVVNKWFVPTVAFAFLLLFSACFGPIAFGSRQFFHRDSGFFYYPLFEQIQKDWERGQLPLWDPYENLGQPLLANPTSSVFYPGKLVFLLSSFGLLSYGICFKWYILLHFPLACYLFYRLMRSLGISRAGSALSALAWTFSGPVAFASCNPVFLIGACWLPAGILCADRLTQTGNLRSVARYAAVLALIVLGGDPETAWLCVALSFGLLVVRLIQRQSSRRIALNRTGLLMLGIVLSSLAAAVQLLPGFDMNREVDRGTTGSPMNVWGLFRNPSADRGGGSGGSDPLFAVPQEEGQGVFDNILCRHLDRPGHPGSVYRFSLPPWRLPELFFPNVGGDDRSGAGRWYSLLPHDDQVWFPSLYFGLVPFLLALVAAFARSGPEPSDPDPSLRNWARWTSLIAIVAAFGAFAPAWLLRVFSSGLDNEIHNGDPVGGLYWMMVTFLPFFAIFRYPAKLVTVAILALAILSGIGFDRVKASGRLVRIVPFLLVPAFGLCAVIGLAGPALFEPLNGKTFSGSIPLDAMAMSRSLCFSFGQTTIVLLLLWFILWDAKRKGAASSVFLGAMIILTAVDLAVAHYCLVPSIHDSEYRRESLIARSIRDAETTRNAPVRIWRHFEWNPLLLIPGDERFSKAFVRERNSLAPKLAYSAGLGIANVQATATQSDYRRFLQRVEDELAAGGNDGRLARTLAHCNVRYMLLPWRDRLFREVVPKDMTLLDSRTPPQYSLRDDFEKAIAQLDDDWPGNVLLWRNGLLAQPIRIDRAVCEGEFVRLAAYDSSRLEFEVLVTASAELVVAEQYWNGWRAKAHLHNDSSRSEAIEVRRDRATGFLRRLTIPAGHWYVTMEYRPASVYYGLVVSLLTWLGLAVVAVGRFRYR